MCKYINHYFMKCSHKQRDAIDFCPEPAPHRVGDKTWKRPGYCLGCLRRDHMVPLEQIHRNWLSKNPWGGWENEGEGEGRRGAWFPEVPKVPWAREEKFTGVPGEGRRRSSRRRRRRRRRYWADVEARDNDDNDDDDDDDNGDGGSTSGPGVLPETGPAPSNEAIPATETGGESKRGGSSKAGRVFRTHAATNSPGGQGEQQEEEGEEEEEEEGDPSDICIYPEDSLSGTKLERYPRRPNVRGPRNRGGSLEGAQCTNHARDDLDPGESWEMLGGRFSRGGAGGNPEGGRGKLGCRFMGIIKAVGKGRNKGKGVAMEENIGEDGCRNGGLDRNGDARGSARDDGWGRTFKTGDEWLGYLRRKERKRRVKEVTGCVVS